MSGTVTSGSLSRRKLASVWNAPSITMKVVLHAREKSSIVPSMLRRSFLVLALTASATTLFVLTGCARTLSPADVQSLARRTYPGHQRAEVVNASATALKTLGYEVVVADTSNGRVKTAPKALVVTAAGSAYAAVAVSNDLAWSLEVTESSDGVVVQATPRASSGGTSYDGPMDADYMEKAIADLFKEIESNLSPGKSG